MSEWKSSACILCECNCGIRVQTGGENERHIVRIRGDEEHPGSQGYLCQKASGLDHYQNGKDRITKPLRRRSDGDFEPIDWDTAIKEISSSMTAIRDNHGGDKIFYYGGGGQGNHLPAGYAAATRKALDMRYRSNALAQEKTGDFWVGTQMFGSLLKGDFEHCDVALFVGKNPWHSHGIQRARIWLKEISKDPERTLIVIDPVKTETAALADIHLQLKPGTDAWLLAAMLRIMLDEDLCAEDWLDEHSQGLDQVRAALADVSVSEYCQIAGIEESEVRKTVHCLAGAKGLSVAEDLGIQMNQHSTLNSYLEKLLWVLCGHFGNKGGHYSVTGLQNIAGSGRSSRVSPVVGAPIISGLVPCNVIAEEILCDHPDRYRAMLVESANPVHSLAGSEKMREALQSLELVVVIDIAMTETAKLADYILPASTQYEKWEATFFNFEFPTNYFHLRAPLFEPLDGTLPEPEIHARLVEAMGAMPKELCKTLSETLESEGRDSYWDQFMHAMGENPDLFGVAPVILYRTLGASLPSGAASAALLWPLVLKFTMSESAAVERAGYQGDPMQQANALFDAILESPSGVAFSVDDLDGVWKRLGNEGKINLNIPELLAELPSLNSSAGPVKNPAYPFVLMAGQRRGYSANTIFRDSDWRRKDRDGALRINAADAASLGLEEGAIAQITTPHGKAKSVVEISDRMQAGHISLPNGFGLDNEDGERVGVAVNELTSLKDRDPFAGTPWHKCVPAKVEAVV